MTSAVPTPVSAVSAAPVPTSPGPVCTLSSSPFYPGKKSPLNAKAVEFVPEFVPQLPPAKPAFSNWNVHAIEFKPLQSIDTDTYTETSSSPTLMKLMKDEIFTDLFVRFLVPLPKSELENSDRVFFALEEAYWYYLDFYQGRSDFREFCLQFTGFCVSQTSVADINCVFDDMLLNFEARHAQFQKYKNQVPTSGCAILSLGLDQVLLVKGWNNGGKWGFPKGKVDKNEDKVDCAVREVKEEIGFDVHQLIDSSQYLDICRSGKSSRIYIVTGVDPSTAQFKTRTRQEIEKIEWHALDKLPKLTCACSQFVKMLTPWIETKRANNTASTCSYPPAIKQSDALSNQLLDFRFDVNAILKFL